jgi:hypothetical protein
VFNLSVCKANERLFQFKTFSDETIVVKSGINDRMFRICGFYVRSNERLEREHESPKAKSSSRAWSTLISSQKEAQGEMEVGTVKCSGSNRR